MAAAKKTEKSGELVIRISKTIQEPSNPSSDDPKFDKYEPLVFDATIRETCTQENYNGRIKELSDLLYVEAAEFLGIETELPEEGQPETEVEESTGLTPPDEDLRTDPTGDNNLQEDLFDEVNLDDVPF